MARFLRVVNPQPGEEVLDIGGGVFNWQLIGLRNKIVLLNLSNSDAVQLPPNFSFIVGDGTSLNYSDKAFDICFSNSVIEHVGAFEKQKMFAREICRVGKKIWLQTPARSFFFEPHYLTPFVHWLPKHWQKKLLRNFSVWGLITRPTQEYVDDFVEQTRLLSYAEIKQLFPGCKIETEKFLFLTKAYLVTSNVA